MTSRMALLAVSLACLPLAACGDRDTATPAAEPGAKPTTAVSAAPALPRTASPEGAAVYFISPADGDTLGSPVHLEFGIEGMRVVPAGVNEADSGHHHLLVDTGMPDPGLPIPADAKHIHYGDGRTSTELELAPGEHTLQLLLGDHLHIPHDPPVASAVITVTVE